jgi:hypothetical protein
MGGHPSTVKLEGLMMVPLPKVSLAIKHYGIAYIQGHTKEDCACTPRSIGPMRISFEYLYGSQESRHRRTLGGWSCLKREDQRHGFVSLIHNHTNVI